MKNCWYVHNFWHIELTSYLSFILTIEPRIEDHRWLHAHSPQAKWLNGLCGLQSRARAGAQEVASGLMPKMNKAVRLPQVWPFPASFLQKTPSPGFLPLVIHQLHLGEWVSLAYSSDSWYPYFKLLNNNHWNGNQAFDFFEDTPHGSKVIIIFYCFHAFVHSLLCLEFPPPFLSFYTVWWKCHWAFRRQHFLITMNKS